MTEPRRAQPETVSARSLRLRSLARHKARDFANAQLDARREAVVETVDKAGWRQATTDNYLSVQVPLELAPGSLVEVRGLRRVGERLQARAVTPLAAQRVGRQEG